MTAAVCRLAAAAAGGEAGDPAASPPALTGPGGPWEVNLRDLMRWLALVQGDAALAGHAGGRGERGAVLGGGGW